jgi:ribosomal protein S18 acetylase RimI-like enzyme
MLGRRPAVADDEPFLRELYLTTRSDLAGWDDAARDAFVDVQLGAQRREWEAAYPGSSDEVLLLDERPVGRLWVAWLPDACVLVDIILRPEHRRAGLGTRILADVLAEADRRAVPTRLTARRTNAAALAFYARFGFTATGGDEVHVTLERPARPQPASA